MDKRYFSKKIVEWYNLNKRDLPWRSTQDPYKVWLSEVILQQTRVTQGLPYYLKFIEAFPTVNDLAQAPEQKVLRLWQGLGYYTRARNLHRCAKMVKHDLKGVFPKSFSGLRKLPGIGDYTAAAIASICYEEPVAVVDGNVFRVLGRVFGMETPINSAEGKRIFTDLANELMPQENASSHNQAVMEFGALFCTPKNPNCNKCIFQTTCVANMNALQAQLPVKQKSKKAVNRYFYYFVLQKGKSLLMKDRAGKDIWHGLYDFYLIEKSRRANFEKVALEDSQLKKIYKSAKEITVSKEYKHVLSHQKIYSRFIRVKINGVNTPLLKELKLYSAKKIGELPKPVLISRYLADEQFL
jgi:A/G-specific adenine glycosylase